MFKKKLLPNALPISLGITGAYLLGAVLLYIFSDFFELPYYMPSFRKSITEGWFHFLVTLITFILNLVTYKSQSVSYFRRLLQITVVSYAFAIFTLGMVSLLGVVIFGIQLILLTVTLDKIDVEREKEQKKPSKNSLLVTSLILTTFYFISLLIIITFDNSHPSNDGLGFLVAFSLIHYLFAFLGYLSNVSVLGMAVSPQQIRLVKITRLLYVVSMFVTVPILYMLTIPSVFLQVLLLSIYLRRHKGKEQAKIITPI